MFGIRVVGIVLGVVRFSAYMGCDGKYNGNQMKYKIYLGRPNGTLAGRYLDAGIMSRTVLFEI